MKSVQDWIKSRLNTAEKKKRSANVKRNQQKLSKMKHIEKRKDWEKK